AVRSARAARQRRSACCAVNRPVTVWLAGVAVATLVYAQVYMVVVALALGFLVIELVRGLDAARFLRRAATGGILAVIILSVWNHEGWIAGENIRRTTRGGPLDVHYLVWNLSVNAVPTIVEALDQTARGEALAGALRERYTNRMTLSPCRWFEW